MNGSSTPAPGTPWFQYVFVRPFNEVVSEAVVKKAVLDTPGVTRILAIDTAIDRLQRGYQVREMEVETVLDQPVTVNSITIGGA